MPRSHLQLSKADTWLLTLHQDLGEPLAVTDPAWLNIDEHEIVENPEHPLWAMSIGAGGKRLFPQRLLNPGSLEDLWIMCQSMLPVEDQVSQSSLKRAWYQRWNKFLLVRSADQGKRCKDCAKLDEERLQTVTIEERAENAAAKKEHIRQAMADREVSVRGNRLAENVGSSAMSVDGLGLTT